MERELYYAIGNYLLAHIERHGHARTAEAFGVSRHTLWRFLDRGQPGRALPRAVMAEAGDTPRKLAAATRALRGETRIAPLERRRPPRLTQALHETLLLVCEIPFASVEDLSRIKRAPRSTLRERLSKLRGMGLAEAHPHRLAMLSDRPLRRHVPTAAGIAALGDDDLLRRHPVSRQWLRLLAERLDGVALIYELAAMIADADPEEDPVRVEHCRSGPYDALVTLSGGRTLGVVRQGPMLSSASLRYRMRTLERRDVQELPHVTLIATDSDQDTRRAVRALREPSGFHDGVLLTVVNDGDAWEYDDRANTYRRFIGRYASLGAEAMAFPTSSAPVGPTRAETVEALMTQWRDRGDEPEVALAGEATLLGRRTQIVELRARAGGVARAFVDPERMFIMRWAVDAAEGGQSYHAEVTALDYGAEIDADRFTFVPPPGAREADAETGGACSASSGPIGGKSFPAEPGFLEPAYAPAGYRTAGTGSESGAGGCDPVAVWALLEAADGGSILLRQRLRPGGMPALDGSWRPVAADLDEAYRRFEGGVLSLLWRDGDVVALLQADAVSIEELVRVAESATLVAARSR